MLFYLRVVPTCASLIPVHLIQDKVASIMFRYPFFAFHSIVLSSYLLLLICLSRLLVLKNGVTLSMKKNIYNIHMRKLQVLHTLWWYHFRSSSSDAGQDDRAALKERFAFYYIKRSLEVVHSSSFFHNILISECNVTYFLTLIFKIGLSLYLHICMYIHLKYSHTNFLDDFCKDIGSLGTCRDCLSLSRQRRSQLLTYFYAILLFPIDPYIVETSRTNHFF